jgi:tripartite-type tricarboxylate transporter receptor subunit TctC
VAAILGLLGLGLVGPAQAQSYPSKPVKIVVPLTPGSPVDVVARLVGQHLSSALGQPVIVENRPGAGSTIGAKAVATAEPDGYTLLLMAASHVIAPSAYKNLTYDPIKDFTAIGAVANSPFVFVVSPSVPVKNLKELVAYAKANPGKLNWGFGLGTSPHLLGELLKHIAHIDIAAIPYKGGANAVTDMLAGQIQMNIGTTATLVPLARSGKLRAVAVTGEARYHDLPDVPTVTESGLPQLSLTFWTGILAPAGVPADVVNKLNSTLATVLRDPATKEQLGKLGLQPNPLSPQDFAKFLDQDMKSWADAVKLTGVKLN